MNIDGEKNNLKFHLFAGIYLKDYKVLKISSAKLAINPNAIIHSFHLGFPGSSQVTITPLPRIRC